MSDFIVNLFFLAFSLVAISVGGFFLLPAAYIFLLRFPFFFSLSLLCLFPSFFQVRRGEEEASRGGRSVRAEVSGEGKRDNAFESLFVRVSRARLSAVVENALGGKFRCCWYSEFATQHLGGRDKPRLFFVFAASALKRMYLLSAVAKFFAT